MPRHTFMGHNPAAPSLLGRSWAIHAKVTHYATNAKAIYYAINAKAINSNAIQRETDEVAIRWSTRATTTTHRNNDR